jgi:hypothetical protein
MLTANLVLVFGFGFPVSGTEGVGCWESDNLVCTLRERLLISFFERRNTFALYCSALGLACKGLKSATIISNNPVVLCILALPSVTKPSPLATSAIFLQITLK